MAGLRPESLELLGRSWGEDGKNSDALHRLLGVSILSLLSFTGSEGLVGCRGQKAFTEKVKLQSGLKDSSRATFPLELDRVGTSVEILYFWLIFITCLFSLLCFLPLARTQLSSL